MALEHIQKSIQYHFVWEDEKGQVSWGVTDNICQRERGFDSQICHSWFKIVQLFDRGCIFLRYRRMLTKGKKWVYLQWNSATFFQLGAGILINRQLQKAVNPKANLCLSKSLMDIFVAHTWGFLYTSWWSQGKDSSPQCEWFGWESRQWGRLTLRWLSQ